MSTISYSINIDLGEQLMGVVAEKVAPLLRKAVEHVAEDVANTWRHAVMQQRGIWFEEKNAYVASIDWQSTGDFSAVVSSGYKYASEIETGRPARDLKRMLGTSQQVRRTEDGRRFLVIPLRHNTPGNTAHAGAMPQAVYGMAKGLAASTSRDSAIKARPVGQMMHLSPRTGMTQSPIQSPFLSSTSTRREATVAAHSYAWGGRLTKGAMVGMDAATRRKYSGMVRMDEHTPGGGKYSAYMTFRVMIEGQQGWVIPSQPGRYIAKKAVDEVRPRADKIVAAAIAKAADAAKA